MILQQSTASTIQLSGFHGIGDDSSRSRKGNQRFVSLLASTMHGDLYHESFETSHNIFF